MQHPKAFTPADTKPYLSRPRLLTANIRARARTALHRRGTRWRWETTRRTCDHEREADIGSQLEDDPSHAQAPEAVQAAHRAAARPASRETTTCALLLLAQQTQDVILEYEAVRKLCGKWQVFADPSRL